MQRKSHFRHQLLGALLCGASLMLAAPAASAAPADFAQQAAAKNATGQALAAARSDFAQFVAHQLQRQGAPADFPLDVADLQDLKGATVSYGFAVQTIDPQTLLAGRGNMQSMARHANQWRFVIMLNERAIGMATVEKNNGRYETVAYGGAVLAKDLDAVAAVHGNADKSNLRFVRIYQARADLLEVVGQDGRARFAPLHSARESLLLQQRRKDGNNGLMEESDLTLPLRAAVKQNMAASQ